MQHGIGEEQLYSWFRSPCLNKTTIQIVIFKTEVYNTVYVILLYIIYYQGAPDILYIYDSL